MRSATPHVADPVIGHPFGGSLSDCFILSDGKVNVSGSLTVHSYSSLQSQSPVPSLPDLLSWSAPPLHLDPDLVLKKGKKKKKADGALAGPRMPLDPSSPLSNTQTRPLFGFAFPSYPSPRW